MGLFKKKSREIDAPLSEMTDRERASFIDTFESARADVVFKIEELMREAADKGKMRKLSRRKYKLGRSPNDYEHN